MGVKFYVVKPGEEVPEDVAKIVGIQPGTKPSVNIVAFVIEGGVMSPSELAKVDEEVRNLVSAIDSSKPVIVTGRGPHWLYGVIVHNLHFVRKLATWEPRIKRGIIIESPTKDEIGMGLDIDGTVQEVSIGGKGQLVLKSGISKDKALLHVEIKGDRFVEPAEMKKIVYPDVPSDKLLVIEGAMPIWLGQRLVAEYVHKVPALAIYDPRLKGGVVVATHTKDYTVGQVVEVKPEEIEAVTKTRQTKVIAVVGDPNSGKSVFLHLLNDALRRMGLTTLTQEGDLMAPTQHWSLFAPEIRMELKKYMSPEKRLPWIIQGLKNAKESGTVDIVLVDLGGGKPERGERLTRENLALLRYIDGLVIVTRNDAGQLYAWINELRTYVPDVKVYAVLESKLAGTASIASDGTGVVVGLDRTLFREGRIPEDTKRVVEEVARRIVADKTVDLTKIETPVESKEGRSVQLKRTV